MDFSNDIIKAINESGIKTITSHFTPKTIKISAPAKEQYDDFIHKYSYLYNIRLKFSIQLDKLLKGLEYSERTSLYHSDRASLNKSALEIFRHSKYDKKLFIEYLKADPSFSNEYISTGLEHFRSTHINMTIRDINPYTAALDELRKRPKNPGFVKTLRGLEIYNAYLEYYKKFKSKPKLYGRAPKEKAIAEVKHSGLIKKRYPRDIVPSPREIVNIYTAFFRFIEQSNLINVDPDEYFDYLTNKLLQYK